MRILCILCCLLYSATTFGCPTCVGLSRHTMRPFFERESFLRVAQQVKKASKNTQQPHPVAHTLPATSAHPTRIPV